jgi:hypothetical protein
MNVPRANDDFHIFFKNVEIHIRMSIHPYDHTHTHSIPISTSERLSCISVLGLHARCTVLHFKLIFPMHRAPPLLNRPPLSTTAPDRRRSIRRLARPRLPDPTAVRPTRPRSLLARP